MRRRGVLVGFLLGLGALAGPGGEAHPLRADPEALVGYRTAHEALARGEFAAAAAGFAALDRDPLLEDYARFFLAETRLRAGDDAAALEGFLEFARRHPSSTLLPQALLAAGDLAFRLGRFAAAAEAYRRFLERAPHLPEAGRALVRLAVARARQGSAGEAIADLRRRWLETPTAEWGQVAREWMEALAREHGLALRPLTLEERMLLAQRLAEGGDTAEAVRLWEEARPELRDPTLRHRLLLRFAPALWRLGRAQEVVALLRSALREPRTAWAPQLRFELARYLIRTDQDAEAAVVLERLLTTDPEGAKAPDALLLLARLKESSQPQAALATLARLATGFPDTPQAAQARWQIGWLHYRAGRFQEAASAFRQLASASPGYRPAALYWTGRALEARQESAEARAAYRELLRLAPRSYYGLLAARRIEEPPAPVTGPVQVAAEPFRLLEGDINFEKGRALWTLGFEAHALAELDAVLERATAEPSRLYGLAVFYDSVGEVGRSLRLLRRHFGVLAEAAAPGLPAPFWQLFYPRGYAGTVEAAAAKHGLDPLFVAAVIREESSYDSRARSWVGAIGLMQLMPETARQVAKEAGLSLPEDGLWEPSVNIPLGVHYLARLKGRFGEPLLAVAGYNAGPHRVERWWAGRRTDDLEEFVEAIPFDETRGFVKRVLASWWQYRQLYGDGAAPRGGMARPAGGE